MREPCRKSFLYVDACHHLWSTITTIWKFAQGKSCTVPLNNSNLWAAPRILTWQWSRQQKTRPRSVSSAVTFRQRQSWPLQALSQTENNTLRICDDGDHADLTIASSRPAVVEFLYDYANKNLAVLNVFIRDPYYTKYLKSEQITPISFIGNAGGLLGLCMGMSFVSIFEVFYHLSNKIFKAIQKCCNFGSKKKIV